MEDLSTLFTGDLIELRAIDHDDLPTYMRWFQDPEVIAGVRGDVLMPITRQSEEEWYRRASSGESGHIFAVHVRDTGRLIGTCGLTPGRPRHRSAVLGITLGEKDCWGRGYGTDTVRVLLRWGFLELNLHRVELRCFDFNQRAVRAYVKAGFVEEVRRREVLFRDGRYWDDMVMGVLRSEWESGRRA